MRTTTCCRLLWNPVTSSASEVDGVEGRIHKLPCWILTWVKELVCSSSAIFSDFTESECRGEPSQFPKNRFASHRVSVIYVNRAIESGEVFRSILASLYRGEAELQQPEIKNTRSRGDCWWTQCLTVGLGSSAGIMCILKSCFGSFAGNKWKSIIR